ncbi:MAG: hypothetical protein APR53_02615 [Methanoculleus sp. SDB]|nr:MAG: hypothetical protein APR53_02615 [Methanoculleus sp. SDB]
MAAAAWAVCLICFVSVHAAGFADGAMPEERFFRTLHAGTYTDIHTIVPLADGGMIAGGLAYNSGGVENGILVRYDADGEAVWEQRFTGDVIPAVIESGDGVYSGITYMTPLTYASHAAYENVTGTSTLFSVTGDGDILYVAELDNARASDIRAAPDGGVMVTGWLWVTDDGYAGFLSKYAADGTFEWTVTYPGLIPHALIMAPDGGWILAGATTPLPETPTDGWMLRTGSDGTEMWRQTYPGTAAFTVLDTPAGGYLVGGGTQSLVSYTGDAWFMLTDETGARISSSQPGGVALYDSAEMPGTGYVFAGKWADSGALLFVGYDGGEFGVIVRDDADGRLNTVTVAGETIVAGGWERISSNIKGVIIGYPVPEGPAQTTVPTTLPSPTQTPGFAAAACCAGIFGAALLLGRR